MQQKYFPFADPSFTTRIGPLTVAQYIGIYAGLILSIIVFLHARIAIFVAMTIRASQNLHNLVFKNLIAAVMRFFDTNPSGKNIFILILKLLLLLIT